MDKSTIYGMTWDRPIDVSNHWLDIRKTEWHMQYSSDKFSDTFAVQYSVINCKVVCT